MRLFAALSLLFVMAQAAASAPAVGGTESLGGQLLDDLTPNIRQQPATPPRDEPKNAEAAPRNPQPQVQPPRFDDLGEDIGQPTGPLSLARIGQNMQQAVALLGEPAAIGRAGQVQQQVVSQLDKLIAELSKQCQGCRKGGQSPQPSQRSQPKPGKSGSTAGRGKAAARDSNDRLDRANAQPVDKGDIDELVKQLWGHLPERSREQMLQSFSDEFLPKYELEIEQYYRRLSEEQEESPAGR